MSETFPTLAVVSAVTGRFVCDSLDEIYQVLGYLLSDELMTHQLPAASRAVEAGALAQHQWIADLGADSVTRETAREWADSILAAHGPTLTLEPLKDAAWKTGNALADLLDIAGDRPVIVVEVNRER